MIPGNTTACAGGVRWTAMPALAVLLLVSCGPRAQAAQHDAAAAVARGGTAGTLVAASPMSTPRAAHTTTTLGDGRILVAGGFTGTEAGVAGAELYDPATDRFSATAGAMATARQSHSATVLPDGRVLLAGGYGPGGDYLDSAELFDPVTGSFVPTGAMHSARAGHVTASLPDGRVLLAGGVGSGWTFLASAEVYDPATGTFAATGSMAVPRESHAVVPLTDGRVLIVGGHRGRGAAMRLEASAEIFDPSTGAFRATGAMTIPRHKHDALLLADGTVLVTGGADERDSRGVYRSVERYDPVAGRFTSAGELRVPRYKHNGTSLLLADGRVLLAGGASSAEVFDPVSGASLPVPGTDRLAGQFSAVAPLGNGGVLITGGYGEGIAPDRRSWRYDP